MKIRVIIPFLNVESGEAVKRDQEINVSASFGAYLTKAGLAEELKDTKKAKKKDSDILED